MLSRCQGDHASARDASCHQGTQPKQSGGKDDVSAIGTRNIGGQGFGNWYSLDKEIALGREYAKEVDASVSLVSDPVVTEYVNRIGQNLVRNSDARVPFTIHVIDSNEMNAFSLPGGFVYVNRGAILAAREEAELAGIMAHEIAHVAARHATRQITRSRLISFVSIPLIFVGGAAGYAVGQAAMIAGPLAKMKFSRSFESEADYLGLQYLYKAGYDPQSFLSFFERAEAHETKKPGTLTTVFSTHPRTSDRIKKMQDELSRILPPRELYVVTTSDFESVQARLHSLEGARRLNIESSEPTLRRTTSSETAEDVDSRSDDEQPTLERKLN